MRNLAQIFDDGCAAFVPAPEDFPDNIPFYRRWKGAEAVVEACGYSWKTVRDEFNSMFHYACCSSVGFTTFMISLKHACPEEPKRPTLRTNYTARPTEATEADAREVFNAQFRIAFKGKRLNSKFAQAKWEQKKDQALKIAKEARSEVIASWQKLEDTVTAVNEKTMAEYRSQCAHYQHARMLIDCFEKTQLFWENEQRAPTGAIPITQ